ncbi:MAG: hypothetical protein GXP32_06770 [Kiritimatiellaeota bacterium]|nr:hypothetical protein [Kiritimatiellota bacterium]
MVMIRQILFLILITFPPSSLLARNDKTKIAVVSNHASPTFDLLTVKLAELDNIVMLERR